MTFSKAEQLLLSLANIPRQEYMNDRRRLPLYLSRIQALLDILGNPEKKIPHYIHVTGTSGKGSVSAYLQSMLSVSGKTTGLYISPHPTHLRERWQVGNAIMTEREFADIMEKLWPALETYLRESAYDMPSFFDLCTVIAFMHFAHKKCSWAVIEVGCGGRYDSTNVLPWKDVAVITNIGLDHTETLGNNKEKIAYEKAGIISPKCAVFTMERDKKVLRVIEKECRKNKTSLSPITDHLSLITTNTSRTQFTYKKVLYCLKSPGGHQAANAGLCIDIARHLKIPKRAIKKGLAQAVQPLRMEVVSKKPLIILDGAHNEDKVKSTISTIKQLNNGTMEQWKNVHLLVGFSEDKDVRKLVNLLATLKPVSVACTRNTVNPFRKAAHPRELQKLFKKILPKSTVETFLDPKRALAWTKKMAAQEDCILVTGSIFLSGELRTKWTDAN